MADDTVLAGYHSAAYMIDEATPGVTPNAAAWDWLGTIANANPMFNPNEQEITGIGSRRFLTKVDGAHMIDFRANIKPRTQKCLLDFLTMAAGSATGTTEAKLSTKSIEVIQYREADDFFLANLYNFLKVRTLTLGWTWGQPLQLGLNMPAQAVQASEEYSGERLSIYRGFQGEPEPGTALTIGSRAAKPAYAIKPYTFINISRPQVDYGAGLVNLPSVDNWTMTLNNTLQPIPGEVEGADGEKYPYNEFYGEEGQTLQMDFTINTKNLDAYKRVLARSNFMDELRFNITHPTGTGSYASTLIKLKNGTWRTGDYSLRELVLAKQSLPATFNVMERVDTAP